MTPQTPTPAVGQVWADNDPRSAGLTEALAALWLALHEPSKPSEVNKEVL